MADGKQFRIDPNYNDVAHRLAELREKHPAGSMQPLDPARPFWFENVVDGDMGVHVFLVYAAACYRTPEDLRPGIGIAWEPFPGRTPYTRDSEVMVAETSAWGRAIVAALAADTKKGIASSEEIAARSDNHAPQPPAPPRKPGPIAQPDKPIAAMTMSEIIAYARENGIPLPSGSKAELIRHLTPLVNAASGAEPFALEGAEPIEAKDDVTDKPFDPVVANPAATARDELKLYPPSARASVRRGE